MAERLHLRGGAVSHAFARVHAAAFEEEVTTPAPPSAQKPATELDIATVAAMSQHPGFPGIAYTRG
jgi:hypothetical protein